MSSEDPKHHWFGIDVQPGASESTSIVISEGYSGTNISIPVYIWRGAQDGPTVAITAAVHGDEINGTGAIRHIIRKKPFALHSGTLVLVPVVNMMGFERHSRYLPDRRDLNRSFPGSADGSLASRIARSFFDQVIKRCDYCIDLHTAAVRRTNFPNVRADMSNERLADFARAFGAHLIVDGQGPKGSLRMSACEAGCATLILEAGEVWKVEPGVVEYAVRGIENCLKHLDMIDGELIEPPFRVETKATKWIRAEQGGFLEFHISAGDIVEKDQALATNTNLMGDQQNVIRSPRDGIVLGMTTLPSVGPGGAVCHLAYPRKGELKKVERVVGTLDEDALHNRVRDDLSRNIRVTQSELPPKS
ncbi:MAG: succinylglutamate desuccinylase/aspartoacylase family protein [Phycisphaerales bacterium]|nr:succinylglutamate desuccinylase/aspartoacylase family protein [Phycisphaerales bacterium]